jgi:hypothetical protein
VLHCAPKADDARRLVSAAADANVIAIDAVSRLRFGDVRLSGSNLSMIIDRYTGPRSVKTYRAIRTGQLSRRLDQHPPIGK